ncbi:MAG: T9SS type A sorting domain-containing protein [Chitinophagales bacterium]|nr:T9SS type A sorting domain-containing protein [Chitinophagales bacterium]
MKVIYAQFFHWLLQKAGYAVAAMLAFAFMIVTAFEHVTAQPAWIGTDVTGAYTTYTLSDLGAFRQSRIYTNTSTVSGTVKWEFMKDNAGSPDYTINWRPYGCCLTIIGYNSAISPVGGTASALYNTGSGGQGGYLPATTATRYYTFNITENSASNNSMCVLETSYIPLTISSSGISQSPAAGSVYPCQSVTVSVTTASAPSSGEYVYVRYTTNGWASSSLVQLSFTGNVGTAVLPTQTSGTTVQYYVMSSNSTSGTIGSNYDLFTLDLLNNSGANYSYTVGSTNVCLTSTSGTTTGGYNTLKSAFDAINAGTHQGAITLNILGNTTETATATLNASGSGSASYTSVTIQPSGGAARTISGNIGTYMIELNGADNVTFDGLNSGGNSLTIDNSNTGATDGTIKLWRDASNNTIKNCTIRGSSTAANSGVILIGTADATLLQGNDNNLITDCVIRESSSGGNPMNGIISYGTSGTPSAKWNSSNTVTNCQIANFYADGSTVTSACGIYLTQGANTDWTITNNSFYWTTSKTTVAANEHYGVRISGGNGNNFVITGNYFGGSSANCGGSAMTFSSSARGNKFCAIRVNVATSGTATSIQGNTVANISLATSSTASTLPYVFCGIAVESGLVNIGNSTANLIGSNSTNGSITISYASTNATTPGYIIGISSEGSGSSATISNNQVSGISVSNVTLTNPVNIYGILIKAGGATISSNIIGSTSLTNSINNTAGSGATTTSNYFLGIGSSSTSGVTISNNTIANLTYNASANTLCTLQGIRVESGTNSVTGNTIYNLIVTNSNVGATTTASVVGILTMSTTPSTGETISQNTIYNIQNSQSGNITTFAIGILFGASGTGHSVTRNRIYDIKLSTSNASTGTGLDAIKVTQGTLTIANNMITLGTGLTNYPFINAINIQGGTPAIVYNSVVVTGGSSSTIANNCIRFQSCNPGTTCINNVLYNDRSNQTAGFGSCMYFANGQVSNVTTCNYNSFYKGSGNNVIAYVISTSYSTLASWQAAFSKDANSISYQPTFTAISTADLHISSTDCGLNGAATVISVTVDYDNATRDATAPDIGADEYTYSSTTWTWTGTTSTDWHTKSNWCPPIVPISTSDVLIPSGPTNMPLISNADAVCHTITINSGASVTMSGSTSRQLTVYANSTTGSFANSGTFTAGIGTVVFDGTGTVSGTTATTFYNVISKTGTLTFNNVVGYYSTVSNSFEIQSGGSVTSGAAPFYATGSTLKYNTGGSYTAYEEWFPNNICSSRGVPHHVVVTGNTSLNFGNESYYREMCGDLTINSGSSFTLSSVSGGDLYIKGNWNDAGTFYPNCRMVKFNGTTSDQTIARTGGGTETFNFMAIDKTGYKLILGSSTDVKLQTSTCATNVAYLYMINGDLDLAGRTLFIEGPTSYGGTGATFMWLNMQNGNRTITSSTAAVVDVKSTYANKTLLVVDGGGSGRLIFDTNITLKDASGEIDFGSGNLATVKGVFQVDNGGAATGNSAHYEVGSILRFTNGNDYQVTVSDKTWADGITGDIGIPYHLEITTSSSSTDVIITAANIADHMIRGNLTITGSTLQLSTGATGDLYIQGNWNRTNGSFSPNSKKVIFQGSSPQTMSVNTASEGFYGLEINNSNGLTLSSGNANVSNTLYLTTGLITTGSNEVYVTNTAAGAVTNHKTDPTVGGYTSSSYVNGNLRRNVTNATSYDFPVGISSAYQLATINFANVGSNGNVLANFTGPGANGTLGSCTINGTLIIGMLNGGYWTMTPNASTTGVQYDVTLIETGFTGFTYAAYTLGVIKRPNSSTNWSGTDFCSVGCHTNSTQWVNGSFTIAKAVRTQVPSFSDFAIGYSYGTPLPVELTTFTVSPVNDDAYLNWNTSSELNIDYFAVERSLDGNVFSQVGIVDAAGFSVMPNDYAFIDPGVRELNAGKIYYRLRMVHSDGSFEYSAVRWISLDESSHQTVLAYPNPFFDELSLMWYAGGSGTGLIQVSDFSGKMVLEKEIPYTEGNNFLMLDQLASFPDGVYILQLNTGRSSRTLKVVKQ